MASRPQILGALLVESGSLSASRLDRILELQVEHPRRIGDLLVERGWVTPGEIAAALSIQCGLPLAPEPLPRVEQAESLVPATLARRARVVPVRADARRLSVATDEPTRIDVLDDVRFRVGRRLDIHVAGSDVIDRSLHTLYGDPLLRLVTEVDATLPDRPAEGRALERAAAATPVVQLVDRLLEHACEHRASDLHIEPGRASIDVRLRIDGVLRTVHRLPSRLHPLVLSRLKIMGGMDISVRMRPQDGGLRTTISGREFALRVSTLPVGEREKAVVRLLDPTAAPGDLASLGMSALDQRLVEALLDRGQGVVLATGPTGSGKSSTLHAALHRIDREGRNVVTLEDPIEYPLAGATQVQVRPRAGLTFPTALRAILRQDPDVVMVGEIRDSETAEIAMSAAVTGHIVLSSLHTNDAPSALVRLLQMGVPRHLVASAVSGVIAQRLVRTVCDICDGVGCDQCVNGYRGRTGVFQILTVTERMREAIASGEGATTLQRMAREDGMGRLIDDGHRLVAERRTRADEIARVLPGVGGTRRCQRCESELPEDAIGCPWCGERSGRSCSCGRRIESGWRWCPGCIRPVPV